MASWPPLTMIHVEMYREYPPAWPFPDPQPHSPCAELLTTPCTVYTPPPHSLYQDTQSTNASILEPLVLVVQRLDPHQNLLQQALEEGADVLAHADGLGLVEVVDLLAHVGELVDQAADLLVGGLGALLARRGRLAAASRDPAVVVQRL